MNDERIRTAVLAREGEARDRIVEGLGGAGADVVGVVDPAIAEPHHLQALDPGAIVVALEPAIEDALERYAGVLSDPAIIVIFEEAAVVLDRTGWDAARWVRHLAAKLRRDIDVLPPSLQATDDDAGDSDDMASASGVEDGTDAGPAAEGLTLDLDLDLEDDAITLAATGGDGATAGYAFDPVSFEHDDSGVAPTIELDPELGAGLHLVEASDDDAMPGVLELRDDDAPARDTGDVPTTWSLDLVTDDLALIEVSADDGPVPAAEVLPAATLDDDLANPASGLSFDTGAEAGPIDESADADALPSFASVEPSSEAADEVAPNAAVHRDLDALEARISGLQLADTDSYGTGPVRGAVLIEGGLGGPDAVRQLLAAIPEGFPRPILVRLQLDGGRYDRLVRQMERVTVLPVVLAEAGSEITDGEIHFVTPDLGIVRSGGRLRFAETGDGPSLPDVLPADDSAVLFLSGADAALVDAAMAPAWHGALVAGQAPEGCYDPLAADTAIARGSASGTPVELAGILVARWMPAHAPSSSPGGLSL
ncbi:MULTISPECIES: chemotaxis protein CheB [Luteimonas]|uniref:chemotaxis protein CheB n=1 Tax=Luteimonas TaxID=83614 RepID=UPI000C7CD7BB|nr:MULTISPECIES: chemotaxis protein CheB [Luteimonas]